MSSIQKRVRNGRETWRVAWRDPDGKQRSKTVSKLADAKAKRTELDHSMQHGTYIDPGRSATTVGALADDWIAGKVNPKPSSRARLESALEVHVRPRWGSVPISRVRHGAVQTWIAQLAASGQSAASVRKTYGTLSAIRDRAVRDRAISANPARGVDLPRVQARRRQYLTAAQVEELADPAGTGRFAVLVLAYCGLRWSELAALRVKRVDLLRRRMSIAEAMVEVNGGRLEWGTPKSHEARSVPIPRFLAAELVEQLAALEPNDLVFRTPLGGPLRNRNARRDWFDPAAVRIGKTGLTPARATAHRGQPGCLGRRECEGPAAHARPRQRGHDSGRLLQPVR